MDADERNLNAQHKLLSTEPHLEQNIDQTKKTPLDILLKPDPPTSIKREKSQQPVLSAPTLPGPRRSSSRPIKRPKFDDELVDTSAVKRSSSRKTSESSPSDTRIRKLLSKQSSATSTPLQPKKKNKKIKASPVPSDFGRWRPTDDLMLINAVTQTCDLQAVYHAIRFSCNFTLKEIQDRWFALLYDPLVSRLAQQSMKALPADVIHDIMSNVLWSREEDCLIADIDLEKRVISKDVDINIQEDEPTLQDFQKLLEENIQTFHRCRTAKTLQNHWLLLRHYQLLSYQTARNPTGVSRTLAEIESKMNDDQIIGAENEVLHQEMSYTDRCIKREIRRLEEEIPQWEIMIEKSGYVEDLELCEFKENALAVIKGRVLKYHIDKETLKSDDPLEKRMFQDVDVKVQVVLGRHSEGTSVDVDFSIEGPSLKISRKQGVITYSNGVFTLLNCGKRPFYVNGQPLSTDQCRKLLNNSVIEIYCLKFLFLINPTIMTGGGEVSFKKQNVTMETKEVT